MTPTDFINRWSASGGAEMANSQTFLNELCDLLELDHPDPTHADESSNSYVFEKAIEFNNGDGTTSSGRIDLYRQGCFVLESKQGSESKAAKLEETLATKTKKKKFRTGTAKRNTPAWEQAMVKARNQAKGYAEAIPDEWPPFLIVADVGYCFDLYADFSQSGKNYVPFPDPSSYRISLVDLENEETRQLFKAIWLDPLSLDPTRRSARVTREVADRLAKLAKSMEGKADAETVAQFLMRCLFTMFAEDVEIGGFEKEDFTNLLRDCRGNLPSFVPMMESLWADMNTGTKFSGLLRRKMKEFNGGLFENQKALPVTEDQLELLIEATEAEWNDVEPAIFGTLLERALDPVERHKLGAHYTPRAYVERLVMPTIIEPLREEWDTVYATAASLSEDGKDVQARKVVRQFHDQLCETRILDPACGSGNFLYVSLELMKRLEGEVLKALRAFGEKQLPLLTVDPHQFLGIEVNPRAAAITDLVLWIGYLQWHFRARGNDPLNEPIIRKFHNIECRDAVLAWDSIEPVVDEAGNPVTRWDGRTTKPHPVTSEEVPDETARTQELKYINPRKAEWPAADYIVGNPPFIGARRIRFALGNGFVEAIRSAYSELPETCDFVLYWWHKAAELIGQGKVHSCGLITTNSIIQGYSRPILALHLNEKKTVSLSMAVQDHPWVDASDGAAVRVAMTVQVPSSSAINPKLGAVVEKKGEEPIVLWSDVNSISARLRKDIGLETALPLESNKSMCFQGVVPAGDGFKLEVDELDRFPGAVQSGIIREYIIGRDIVQRPKERYIIDCFGFDETQIRTEFPSIYQHLKDTVFPERRENRRKVYREKWWLFAEPRPAMRKALKDLNEFVVTPYTSKFRPFTLVEGSVAPDAMAYAIATNDCFHLGVLSASIHVIWAGSSGSKMGVGNDSRYTSKNCFFPFPFPDPDDSTKQRIRDLGEQLDVHRKRQQAQHSDLTMTGMYNVLEKLRSGEELTKKEKIIHEQGLVSVLKQIHDDLDAAVFDAYGWAHDLTDEEILEKLVELNHERAAEEAAGKVRWLRPEFQNPDADAKQQKSLDIKADAPKQTKAKGKTAKVKVKKQPWPKTLPERITAVRSALVEHGKPASAPDIAKRFTRANKETIEELLETLTAVGQARVTDDGRYAA